MLTPALERAEAAVDAAYALHDERVYAPPADRLAAMQAARAEAVTPVYSRFRIKNTHTHTRLVGSIGCLSSCAGCLSNRFCSVLLCECYSC